MITASPFSVKALTVMSAEYADIFKAHIMLLESPDFFSAIEKMVKEDPEIKEIIKDITANINIRYE